jgi:hypothetical protein
LEFFLTNNSLIDPPLSRSATTAADDIVGDTGDSDGDSDSKEGDDGASTSPSPTATTTAPS